MSSNPPARSVSVEVVTDPSLLDLDAIAEVLGEQINTIKGHEDAHMEATLEHRLLIGLQVCRAQHAFTAALPNATGKNQHSKEVVSPGDTTSPTGFNAWLKKAAPDLKRPTAYLYANAVRGLGLDYTARPDDVSDYLTDRRRVARSNELPAPTLKALAKEAPKLPAPPEPEIQTPKDSAQLRLEDAREASALMQDAWEKFVSRGQLDDLDLPGVKALHEFLLLARDQVNKRLK